MTFKAWDRSRQSWAEYLNEPQMKEAQRIAFGALYEMIQKEGGSKYDRYAMYYESGIVRKMKERGVPEDLACAAIRKLDEIGYLSLLTGGKHRLVKAKKLGLERWEAALTRTG